MRLAQDVIGATANAQDDQHDGAQQQGARLAILDAPQRHRREGNGQACDQDKADDGSRAHVFPLYLLRTSATIRPRMGG
jgi:hypothetical protein